MRHLNQFTILIGSVLGTIGSNLIKVFGSAVL